MIIRLKSIWLFSYIHRNVGRKYENRTRMNVSGIEYHMKRYHITIFVWNWPNFQEAKTNFQPKKKDKNNICICIMCVLNIKTCLEGRAITSVVCLTATVSLLIKINFFLIDMCSTCVCVCHWFDVLFSVFMIFCRWACHE